MDSSQRDVWTLTEEGRTAEMTDHFAIECYQEVRRQMQKEQEERDVEAEFETDTEPQDETDVDDTKLADWRTRLLGTLKALPPDGFERVCERLLRESGFQQMTVTGRTGDGGIDGHGILQVNPLVSFKVLFQCKRYGGTVSVSVVRDFRGALQGRADKGLILTTGAFTTNAKKEAIRDGATPIELVDGDKLVEMFEQLQLGLVPRTDFDIDEKFFDEFR
jgi:restriction system protein